MNPGSPTPTEEWSPEPETEHLDNAEPAQDFARIYPVNDDAKSNFSSVAKRFEREPGWMKHARKFIQYDHKHSGYYRLSLGITPGLGQFVQGWTVGSGDPRHPENVDILLTTAPADSVGQRHLRFVHHPVTDILLVCARHDTIIDGKKTLPGEKRSTVRKRTDGDSIMTVDKEIGITVGPLMYRIDFTPFSETTEYQKQLKRIRERDVHHQPLTDTPTPATDKKGVWRLWPAKWGGSYGTVALGYHSEKGFLVIAKRVRRNLRNFDSVKDEIDILRNFREHPHPNVCALVAVWPETAESVSSDFFQDKAFDEIHLMLAPVASGTLEKYCASSKRDSLTLFKDVCQGIAHSHSQGIMHRDIKPPNICVNTNPLIAILIDFGHATKDIDSSDHEKGTIPYLAPEIIAWKKWNRGELEEKPPRYDRAVDIWALGVSFMLKVGKSITWNEIDSETWERLFKGWDAANLTTAERFLRAQIRKALAWKPEDRPSASELAENVDDFLRIARLKRNMN